jgi:hypothetical protein
LGQLAAAIDYIQYLWQTNVIAYDTESRIAAIQQVDAAIGRGMYMIGGWTASIRHFVDEVLPVVSLNIIGAAIVLSLAVLLIRRNPRFDGRLLPGTLRPAAVAG